MNNLIIGETCLLSKQLKRLGIIDGPTKMFDDTLVNLDSVKLIIEHDFENILKDEYLKFIDYMFYPEHNIHYPKWINNIYSIPDSTIYSWPIYSPLFHHDNATQQERESYLRKIERTKQIFENKDTSTTLFYYHRQHNNSDYNTIITKYIEFIQWVNKKYNRLQVNQFKGVLITNHIEPTKTLTLDLITSNLIHGHFTSPHSWIGIDDNWDAHTDNELFDQFFDSNIYKSFL